jgi:two-component system chemotaxis sensor kinase CheA
MAVSRYRELFLNETAEHLQSLTEHLLLLEQGLGREDVLNSALRSAHTLKGMAAAMGYKNVSDLTHGMESALMSLQGRQAPVTPAVMDPLFKSLDALQAMVGTRDTVRVKTSRLDLLGCLAEELNAAATRLKGCGAAISDPELQGAVARIGDLAADIGEVVRKIRMIPAHQVFGGFPLMVRRLSRQMDKEIRLVIQGGNTELDCGIAEEIVEPLLHLLRNAVDHGIESPEERKQAGKGNPARLSLCVRPGVNEILIEIADDGRGIDLDQVRARAVKDGLLAAGAAVDEAALLNLIFEPGFSTAGRLTDVSGRGLGLGIVKSKIVSLGGSIDVETRSGQGVTFTIRLPDAQHESSNSLRSSQS